MPNLTTPGMLRRLLIPALLLSAAAPALAQMPAGAVVQPLSQSTDPAELLAQALRTLATEPNNLAALTTAGHNAVILGDPNAAVGFFGRAQEIAPNDGRVKAGLGSALVQLEKPQDALRLFAEASRLGVPEAEFAGDRGLAYDLTGDQRRAQADYQTVLAAHPEDDTARRRLALSQGISGQKATAIATLDPLIRKRDIAAWRAQTFVLAMDGDAKGANDITRVMLPQQATMLQPFLVRLATLSPADKARAVHFGEMPATGATYTPTQVASVDTPATYASAPARQPAPRSDLAPLPAKTVTRPTPAPALARTVPAQVATATPPPAVQRPPEASSAAPDQARLAAAPLAGIALTPTTPAPQPVATATVSPVPATVPTTTGPSPQPAVQIAQAAPLHAEISGPPAPPPSELPTPAAQGHYDLPHDAATRTASRPAPVPAPTKTVGTPVVHGKTSTASSDADTTPVAPTKKTTRASAKTELAGADTTDTKPAKKAAARDEDADTTPVKGTKGKSTAKTRTAAADDDEDCAPAKPSRSKGHTKTVAKKKASTTCTQLASKDDDSDAVSTAKTKKGAKSRASAVDDDADDSKAKSSKSSRSAKADKSATEKGGGERIYVQIAGGANRDDMDKAWAGVKKKAPELMKGHSPLTTPLKATNRLLVGPFKTDDEAQAFVNKMAAKGLSGFTFKSSKGQKVDKIDTGQ